MYTHKQVQLVDSGGGGGLGEAFLSVHPQLISATPRKHRCPEEEGLYIYINIFACVCVCVSRACLAHTVLTCIVFTPADFKLPGTPRKHRCFQDDAIYLYKYVCVCVCVSRSCLAHTRADMYGGLVMYTHKQIQLVDSWGGGRRF